MKKQKKDACFSIRMTSALRGFLLEEAEAHGISVSGYIRMLALEKKHKINEGEHDTSRQH